MRTADITPDAARHRENVVRGHGLSRGKVAPLTTTREVERWGTQQRWGVSLRLGLNSGLQSHLRGTAGRVGEGTMNRLVLFSSRGGCRPASFLGVLRCAPTRAQRVVRLQRPGLLLQGSRLVVPTLARIAASTERGFPA